MAEAYRSWVPIGAVGNRAVQGRSAGRAAPLPSIASVSQRFDTSGIECFVVGGNDAVKGLSRAVAGQPGEGAATDQLARALLQRAVDWAGGLTGSAPEVVELPRDLERLESSPASTILLVRPALVRFSPEQARDLTDDLGSGCNVVIGPTLAGGWYLLALSGAALGLVASAGDGGPGSAGRLLAAAREVDGLDVGLLRAERDLNGDSDVQAAAADPLVDMEVTRLLAVIAAGGQGFEPR